MKQIGKLNNINKLEDKDVEFNFSNCTISIFAEYAKIYVTELSKPGVGVFKSENGDIWIGQMSGDEYIDLVVFTVDNSVIYPNHDNKWCTSGCIHFNY
jgi:hypothetical protein